MAIPPLMVFDHYTTPQAHRLLNGTTLESTQLGGATGLGVEATPTNGRAVQGNRMVIYERDLFLMHRAGAYKFTFGTKLWTPVLGSLVSGSNDNDQTSGLYLLENNSGDQVMVLFYRANVSTTTNASTSTDGVTWTNTFANANISSPRYTLPFQGKLWYAGDGQASKVCNFDPATLAVQNFDWASTLYSGGAGGSSDFSVNAQLIAFQGRLFWIGTDTSGGNLRFLTMLELVGGGFARVPISGGSNPGLGATLSASPLGAVGAFEYDNGSGPRLYVVFWANRNTGTLGDMRVLEYVPNGSPGGVGGSFQENDISATVIPPAWLAGGAFENNGSTSANVLVHVDVSSPGSPQVFWWRLDNFGSAISTFWTWNGPAALCTVVNSVGHDYSFPQSPNSTGERIYTEGDFPVTLENTDTQPSKIFFDVTVHQPLDSSTPGAKQGRLWYSVGGADWQVATLTSDVPSLISGVGPAPTISANLFQNILVNGDKWDAAWDAPADGFSTAGLQFELLLEVF